MRRMVSESSTTMTIGREGSGGTSTRRAKLRAAALPPPPLPAELQRYQGLVDHMLAKSPDQRLTAAELLAVLKIDFALAA